MIWDLYQNQQINSAQLTAGRAASKTERQGNEIDDLQDHVERLSLACQAMWEIMRERSGLTEDQLERKILEIDGRDGQIDGKINTPPMPCPSCGRTTSSRRNSCVMCGAPTRRPHQFEA